MVPHLYYTIDYVHGSSAYDDGEMRYEKNVNVARMIYVIDCGNENDVAENHEKMVSWMNHCDLDSSYYGF